jgi:uncharacterized membrane protein YesL
MGQPKNPFLSARILIFTTVQSVLILIFIAYSIKTAPGTSAIFSQEIYYILASLLCLVSFALPRLFTKFLPPRKMSFETIHEAMRFHHTPLILALVVADAAVMLCFAYAVNSGDMNPLLGIGIFSIAIMVSHLPSEQKIKDLYRIGKKNDT